MICIHTEVLEYHASDASRASGGQGPGQVSSRPRLRRMARRMAPARRRVVCVVIVSRTARGTVTTARGRNTLLRARRTGRRGRGGRLTCRGTLAVRASPRAGADLLGVLAKGRDGSAKSRGSSGDEDEGADANLGGVGVRADHRVDLAGLVAHLPSSNERELASADAMDRAPRAARGAAR